LPPPEEWQHSVYLTADDGVQTSHDGKGLPFGESISFETDSFKGSFFLRLRNGGHVASSPYFDGKRRLYQLVIQGQFKVDDIALSDVVLGQVYNRSLKGVPSGRSMMGKMIKRFVEGMSPGVIFDIFHDKQPMVLAPIGSCQTMRVDLPGDEPSDFDEIKESTALLGYLGSGNRRRKILSKPTSAAEFKINKDHVYTFEIFDHTMDFGTFHQHLMGGMKVDLIPSLDGQSVSHCLEFGSCLKQTQDLTFSLIFIPYSFLPPTQSNISLYKSSQLSLGLYTREDLSCLFNFSLFHKRAYQE
jgi:hypothetical protein